MRARFSPKVKFFGRAETSSEGIEGSDGLLALFQMFRSPDLLHNFVAMAFFMDPQAAVDCLHKLTICIPEGFSCTEKVEFIMMEYNMTLECHIQPKVCVQVVKIKV